MVCPTCQHRNAEGARFCENCGYKLTRECPNCHNPVSPSSKFCPNCGYTLTADAAADPSLERLKKLVPKEFAERLLKSRGQVERERRIVTILFSDVKGSTALGEERDPEEILEIMNGAFDALIEPIYRYEGTLARLMGDAILAFFGAPIAHEDDPVRAVLAALAIQDKMKDYASHLAGTRGIENFSVRVGINTGLVVVGEVGSDLRVEYTAMGDAINVASRLEGAARPGQIVISDATARLVRHAFDLESLGGLELKGKSEPVPAFRVIGRKAKAESARGIEGLHSPLVGREREAQALRERLAELKQGRGQIVSVMGEAGLGKSRLAAEAKEWTPGVQWWEGRAQSYESSTPYAPFVNLLSAFFGVEPEQKDAEQYAAIRSRLGELIPGREDEMAPFFANLLGIGLTGDALDRVKYLMPPDLRERTFRAVIDLVSGMAAQQPAVLVLEDLHWADSTSLELALRLMEVAESAPLLLLALFRPQRQEPSWRFHETAARDYAHRYTAIELQPLDAAQARQLVANLLEIEDLPEAVRGLILKKAEGNPFFVEEVIRSLLDSGLVVREDGHWRATREIADLKVPDTLSAVIAARLDRLDDEARRVAQTASVIGREFQRDVLDEVYEAHAAVDDSLRTLNRRELIREKARLPLAIYLFKHALTQEAAYASVLMSRRRELHRRIGECLERLEPDRVNDIARHFLEAKEEKRALPYLLAAGENASRAYAMPDAIGYFTRAVEIARAGDDLALTRRAYEGLGGAQNFAFDVPGAVKTFQEMLQLAEQRDDPAMQVSAMNKLAQTLAFRMGQFPEAEEMLGLAERLASEKEDKAGLSEMYFVRCSMCTAMGDYDGVVKVMQQAAEYGRDLGMRDQIVASMDHVARSHLFMTRFEEARQTVEQALPMAREIENRDLEGALLFTLAGIDLRDGLMEEARKGAAASLEIGTRIGAPIGMVYGAWALGEIARATGDYARAIEYHTRANETARPFEPMLPFVPAMTAAALGATYLEISPDYRDRATELFGHARQLLTTPAGMAAGGTAWLDIGFAELAGGNLDAASEWFEKGLNAPTMMGYLNRARFLMGRALVAAARGQTDKAARSIHEAQTFVQERRMKNLFPAIALADGQVRAACGELEGALAEFQRADALAAELGMRPIEWEARAGAAQALAALGRAGEAAAQQEAARAVVDEMAAAIPDAAMRAAFEANAAGKVRAA